MEEMISQLKRMGIEDGRVLGAISRVDRGVFMPEEYQYLAYSDTAVPIGSGQTISQPYTVARMLELLIYDLRFKIHENNNILPPRQNGKVLEIGTGSGWQTAILTKLFNQVYSMELIAELARKAEIRIQKSNIKNVKIGIRDGKTGWKEHSPFDAIICGADASKISQAWKDQLADGGRIVCPVRGVMTRITRIRGTKQFRTEKFERYAFVPLV